jgi:hypothetical protein
VKQYSRRSFLKFSVYSMAALAFKDIDMGFGLKGNQEGNGKPRLGRTVTSLRYYVSPTITSQELGYYNTDSVVEIHDIEVGDPQPTHNPLWYRTERGWVHSSSVQPVRDEPAEVVWDVPAKGFLAEVCVPYAQAWMEYKSEFKRAYRLYYASTHWVTLVSKDDYGYIWYQIVDDLKGGYYYVEAEKMRRVEAAEVAPISPEVMDKRILIKLAEQKIAAYENGRMIMTARCSTGTFEGDTPLGDFTVERKQPSRHMAATESHGNGFDLPGVPWVSYISWTGVSLHGTYWHNDYGTPRSHGCINLSPAAALWVYRWTMPPVQLEDDYEESDSGTLVQVV